MALDLPKSINGSTDWSKDACKYCFHRPQAPAGTADADKWWYGTGDGSHNPRRCQPLKRFLAEGGDPSTDAQYASHLRGCLELNTNRHRAPQS